MARGRMVSTTIATDKALNSLSIEAELLYLKAIPHLDRDGLIAGDDDVLIAKIAPRRQRELFDRMEAAICEWIDAGLVLRYDSKDGQVLFFQGFAKNNKLRYEQEGPSNFPPPPGYTRTATGLEPADVQGDNAPTTHLQRSNPVVTTLPKPLNVMEGKVNASESEREGNVVVPPVAPAAPKRKAATALPTPDAARVAAVHAYETSVGLIAGAQQAEEIHAMLDDLDERGASAWWPMALKVAEDRNARNWSFVRGVLNKCLAQNTPPGVWPNGAKNGKGAPADPLQAYSVDDLPAHLRAVVKS